MNADLMQHARAVHAEVLSAGGYATFLTATGAGYAAWRDLALTRWNADPLAAHGLFIYLRDLDSGKFWSIGQQPICHVGEEYRARFDLHQAELLCRAQEIEAQMQLRLAPDVELRRITLRNLSAKRRRIELTSYAEVVLNTWAADASHPAFSKLFIQTAWAAQQQALLAWRRPRSPDEPPCYLAHAISGATAVQYETSREHFIGRGYSYAAPRALVERQALSAHVGNVLDPIISLRHSVELAPQQSLHLTFLLAAASDAQSVIATLERYLTPNAVAAVFAAGADLSRRWIYPQSCEHWPLPAAPHNDLQPASAEELQFWNGYGGFNATGDEYVLRLQAIAPGRLHLPPQPWVNVIANAQFGFITSETGGGCTWSQNSRENRLTAWHNDALLDTHSEALYVRDMESGKYWSLLPGPLPAAHSYEVRHGFGYSHYRQRSHGLEQEVTLYAALDDPLKIVHIRLRNLGDEPRRLALFSYAQLALGSSTDPQATQLALEQDGLTGALLAENQRPGFAGRMVFAAAAPTDTVPLHVSGDRATFLGHGGTLAAPAALRHGKSLDGRLGTGLDPCFALQVTLHVEAEASVERLFLLGEAESRDGVRRLIRHYGQLEIAQDALAKVRTFWQEQCAALQVQTPVPALDLLVNGWGLYQTLSCRLWGRSAFYQSGGAFGFRDQLQDAAALIYHDPALTRQQLLLHAAHQFVEGDVLHWWHPPLGCGIRTRFSDDLLWLPYLAAFYSRTTGDWQIFNENVPFISGPLLREGEDEAFISATPAGESASLYEHCCRALDRSLTQGIHGLPLMGSGDWNDGMNRVGRLGRGESVWMGFFLYTILGDFIPVCGQHGDHNRARRYAAFRTHLATALHEQGWDGAWYQRAWYDSGAALGSANSDECQIDALVQAWAVISKAAPAERVEMALDAVERRLIAESEGIIRLLTPPFVDTPYDPGYIKGYVAGVRENGGQYTHAALWVVRAFAEAGRREQAARLLEMLTPIHHSRDLQGVAKYRLEPFAIAADIYGAEPHIGRGGWSWYTGAAGWFLRVMLESILGLEVVEGHALCLHPSIPDAWPGFSLRYRLPNSSTVYQIEVLNPQRNAAQVVAVELDEQPGRVEHNAACIPLCNDGLIHQVRVTMGALN